ncbi:reverse transcriptase domain-containing protein [Tanacetum coccineum]
MAPKKRTTRASPATTTTTTSVTNTQLQAMIDQGVANALAARDANRSTNGDENHNSGTGVRRTERAARECTYTDFLKCQPLNFKGTEGVVGLSQWFERMESVFHISNCTVENQVKFATCTLHSVALTWWNTHVKTVGHDAAYGMPWKTLMKMMTDKYCPRNEIKKLEMEIWDLKVKGTDLTSYTQRFQELALLCGRMFPEESDKIERYVGGLPDMIHGSVVASKPKTMQEAIEMATELMDKKIRTFAERQAENKRKLDNNNQTQQQPTKKQGVAIAYTAWSGERKEYAGTLPLCNKCKFHHNGQCTVKCANCKKVGHLTRDCRSPAATNNQRNLTCYECGNQGHYRSDCPELKNQNYENQAEGTGARGMVHALGGGETNQDLNDMEEDINA